LTKDNLLEFFDNMVQKDMKKLSVQEFSQKAQEIPTTTPEIRGYHSKLIDNHDFLRKRNKFVKLNYSKKK
jgi:hypothetical protein